MLQKIARLLLLPLLLIPLVSLAQEESFALKGWVTDQAQVLSVEQKQTLTDSIAAYEQQTSNEIAVLILKSLNGVPIENIAVETFNTNGIGKKGKDNGVLLVVALEDKKARIEVGYGLEGDLTDLESSIILRESIFPYFKEGKYSEGIFSGVSAIEQAIGTEITNTTTSSSGEIDPALKGLFIILWVLIGIMSSTRSIWLGGVVAGIGGGIFGFIKWGIVYGVLGAIIGFFAGLLLDFVVSRVPFFNTYFKGISSGRGGFGGFGGGRSGGGGASGGW